MAPPVEGRRFDCSFCAKAFVRHEHQKRHELTVHAVAKPYRCQACRKEFVRKDALQRHESTHQASSPSLLQIGARACCSCATARVKCSGDSPCKRCLHRELQCLYPDRGISMPPSSSAAPLQAMAAGLEVFGVSDVNSTPNALHFEPDFWDPTCLASTNWLDTLDLDGFDIPGQGLAPSAIPAAVSYGHGHGASGEYSGVSPALTATTGIRSDDAEPIAEAGEFYVDGEPARLPRTKRRKVSTVTTPPARSQGGILSLRSPAYHITSSEVIPISAEVYSRLLQAYRQCCLASPSLWPSYENVDFPSKAFCEHLLWLYKQHFHHTLPFLHESWFASGATLNWAIVLVMIAIGSHYLSISETTDFSTSLHEFGWRIFNSLDEDAEGTSVLPVIDKAQLLVLHAVGCAYCGDIRVSRRAQDVQQRLATSFDSILEQYREAFGGRLHLELPDQEEAFRRWCSQQSLIRIAHCIWLLDTMSAYHFQRPPSLTFGSSLSLPLPCHEKLWRTGDLNEWSALIHDQTQEISTLSEALQQLYIDKKMPRDRGEFARILIIHGIFQRSWAVERYFSDPLSHWEPVAQREDSTSVLPSGGVWLPSVPIFAKWQNTACDSLDVLHWQANATIGQASGLEHPTVLHLHAARVVLLVPYNEIVRFARSITAGSSPRAAMPIGNDVNHVMNSPDAMAIRSWATKHQYKARLSVIHAGVVFWHVRRYSIDAFYEGPAVALAALTLWAFGTFAATQHSIKNPQSSNSARQQDGTRAPSNEITATRNVQNNTDSDDLDDACDIILLDRPTDDELVQHFIKDGYKMQAHLGGVGNLYSQDGPRLVLRQGCKLLSSSAKCWGVAFEWQELLEALSKTRLGRST